jgi:hypothetical protein
VKARVRQAVAWFRKDKTQRALQIAVVALGAKCLQNLLEDTEKRLSALEDGGLVPLDDVVTLKDHSKLESRMERIERVVPLPVPPPVADVEVAEEDQGAVGATVGPEGTQEGQESS